MFQFDVYKRVRYGETDKMGYLYYGHYPLYYEIGRTEAFRHLGLVYDKMEKELGIMMPVMSMQVRYLRPAKYDELITIKTIMKKLPVDEVTIYNELYNEKGELINQGTVKLCYVDMLTGQRVKAPAIWNEQLKPWFAQEE